MKIELKKIKIKEVFNGYKNNDEEGVIGFSGKLNIRPKYQREFVYKDKQREEVINTIRKKFPLNVLYWVKSDSNSYEVLDGQQRTISFCSYINGDYSINFQYFHNLTDEEKEQIMDYELMIYICEGTNKEKLEWFKIINIAGEKLTDQELRNAIYTGTWLTDAKKYFSKSQCVAYQIGNNYLDGSPIRQDYLEKAIKWISNNNIEDYMSKHQHDSDCLELWTYFQNIITWINTKFPKYQSKIMKGLEWGFLYNDHKNNKIDAKEFQNKIDKLLLDDEIQNKKGIIPYLLTRQEKYLNIRSFTDKQKLEVFTSQNGICKMCNEKFDLSDMEADHITPWCEGGKTTIENCQMLCKNCNRRKSNK